MTSYLDYKDPNRLLVQAAAQGFEHQIFEAINKGATGFDEAIEVASREGYEEIVRILEVKRCGVGLVRV